VTFKRFPRAEADFAAIVAARIGKTRLIDNMTLGANDQD
jgi:pantothenate synthetase